MIQQSPQFIPDPYGLWKAVAQLAPNKTRAYPVVGWAVFRGFAVEPMVFDPSVGRAVTVLDLTRYHTPADQTYVTVILERV